MKKILICGLVSISMLASAESFSDSARVLSVETKYSTLKVPVNECTTRLVEDSRRGDVGGAVLGGIAGGVIGSHIGGGRGREAATAAGVMLGAIVGDQWANNQHQQPTVREVNVCNTVYVTEQVVSGYLVNYEYLGQRFKTITRNNPGQTLSIRVNVTPYE